jgi:hypothetical protein
MENKVEEQVEELKVQETEEDIKADDTVNEDENPENLEESKEEGTEKSETDSEEDSEEESEVVVTIGDEESPTSDNDTSKPAPTWVKELRKTNRELKKQNRELQEKLNSQNDTEIKPVELGKKPTLESCDYDSDRYDSELQAWYENKIEVDKQKAKQDQEQKVQEQQWQERLTHYEEAKNSLKVIDYEEAEFAAQEALSSTQQGMIIEGADNPALMIYALGKNPKKLKEISEIKQPVKFAFAVSKLETQLKIANKNRPTSKPEKKIQSSSGSSSAVNSTLERLREEAAKSGDFTKVMQYKRQLKKT